MGPFLTQPVQEPDMDPVYEEGGDMWHQCRVMRHIIEEHIFLLMYPGQRVLQLPHNGDVCSEYASADHPGPPQLALGLKESGGQEKFIRSRQDISAGKL